VLIRKQIQKQDKLKQAQLISMGACKTKEVVV
jgi:hypothetical protein